ncbi:MAG: DUF4097 family beta strand repeat-containing protein, partial [Actinomycetota bacterium]
TAGIDLHLAAACRGAQVTVTSGSVTVRGVDGPVQAHTTSGRIDVALLGAHDVHAETVSGRIKVSLPAGVRAHVVEPGVAAVDDGSTARPSDADCVVVARSTSGRVSVTNR